MYKGPQSRNYASTSAVNQITGDLPLYRPRQGAMVIRVIPAFENNMELPWVDFEQGLPSNNDGLGPQHSEQGAIQIFLDKTKHLLSQVSRETPESMAVKSPAAYVEERMQPLFAQAKAAAAQNIEPDPRLAVNDWGNGWIQNPQLHMLQAVIMTLDGKPCLDARTGQPRRAIIEVPYSAVKNLRGKLFQRRQYSGTINAGGASATDNQFGDYCSCAAGHQLVIMPSQSEPNKYECMIGDAMPINPDWAVQMWVPWDRLALIPLHVDVLGALQSILPEDLYSYGLLQTPYEQYLSPQQRQLGMAVRAVPVQQVHAPAPQYAPAPAAAPARPAQPAAPPPWAPQGGQMVGSAGNVVAAPPVAAAPWQGQAGVKLPAGMEQLPHLGGPASPMAPQAPQPPAPSGPTMYQSPTPAPAPATAPLFLDTSATRPPVSPMAPQQVPVIPPLSSTPRMTV